MGIFSPYVTVAAADSGYSIQDEGIDFVCAGESDERIINQAIARCVDENKNLFLINGTYRIDGFHDMGDGGPLCAICFPAARREITVIGQNVPYTKKDDGVRIYVSERALSKISGEDCDVIRTAWCDRGIGSGSSLRMENFAVLLSNNSKPVRCIDLRRCDRVEIKNVRLNAYADLEAGLGNPPPIASEGCIGLTMTDGSNHSYSAYTHLLASGFYEGIQVGGEHVVMTNCGSIMCYYGMTFGNYESHCGSNHPITLINCLDERNVNLPLFNDCGDDDGMGGRLHGGQEVSMISFNVERIAKQTPGGRLGDLMRETRPGTFCGKINYTVQEAWCSTNSREFDLWENDGSGVGFTTENLAARTLPEVK